MLDKIKSFFDQIKEGLFVLASLLALIFAGLFVYEKKKDEVDKVKGDNAEVKGKVEQIDSQINDLEKQTKEKENEPVTKEGLLDFLNGTKSK